MSNSKQALILGASGLIGSHLLGYLMADESYDTIHSVGRRELDPGSVPGSGRKLVQHVAQIEQVLALSADARDNESPAEQELRAAFAVQDIFCCVGTTMRKAGSKAAFEQIDYAYPLHAARIGLASRARQFLIVTAIGADSRSPIYYNRIKGRVEESLERLQFHAIHIFQPSLLTGARNESRTGEDFGKLLGGVIGPLMLGPLRKYRPIAGKDVARGMLQAARKADSGIHSYESDRILDL